MDQIEERQKELAWAEKNRTQALSRIFAGQDAERKALIERAVANAEAAEAARVKAQQQQHVAGHEQNLKESLRAAYVVANGDDSGFEDQYPALRQQLVQAQTLAGATNAKPGSNVDAAKAMLRKRYGG